MKAWLVAIAGLVFALACVCPTSAEVPPKPQRSLADVISLFPDKAQLPAGLVLNKEGSRSAEEIAEAFPDPGEAKEVLSTWAWGFNAYRVYEGAVGDDNKSPIEVEISLHQFSRNICAAYALPYFALGRAEILGGGFSVAEGLGPCDALVTGNTEVTRYLRYRDLLIRVTVIMAAPLDEETFHAAYGSATETARAVLENAGGTAQELVQICQ